MCWEILQEKFARNTSTNNSFATLLLYCESVRLYEYESGFSPGVVYRSVSLSCKSNEGFKSTYTQSCTDTQTQTDTLLWMCLRWCCPITGRDQWPCHAAAKGRLCEYAHRHRHTHTQTHTYITVIPSSTRSGPSIRVRVGFCSVSE